MPAKGGEYCMADLFGQWRMVSGETVTEGDPEVWNFTASEMEIDRRLTFHSSWDETEPDGVDYYDEWHPGYLREAQAMAVEYQETPIYEGCGNEAWRLQLFSVETIYQNYASNRHHAKFEVIPDNLGFPQTLKCLLGGRILRARTTNGNCGSFLVRWRNHIWLTIRNRTAFGTVSVHITRLRLGYFRQLPAASGCRKRLCGIICIFAGSQTKNQEKRQQDAYPALFHILTPKDRIPRGTVSR